MRLFVVLAACLALASAQVHHKSSRSKWSQESKGKSSWWSWPFSGSSSKLLGASRYLNQAEDYLNVCQEPYRQHEVQQDVLTHLRETQKTFQDHVQASASDDTEQVIDAFQGVQRNLADHLAAVEGAMYAIANLSTPGPDPDEQCVQPIQQQLQLTHASLHELEKEVIRSAAHVQDRTGKDRLVQIQSALSQLMHVVNQAIRSPSEERIKLVYSQCRDIRPAKRMQQARDALKTMYASLKDESEKTKTNAIEAVTGIVLQATELHAICHGAEHFESSDLTQKYILEQDIQRVEKIFDQVQTMIQKIARGSRWFF